MNNMVKKLLIKSVSGFFSGLLLGVFFTMPEGMPNSYLGLTGTGAGILYLACCGLYGAAAMAGMLLYDIEHYSLLRATSTHFMVMMAGLFFLGFSLGWQPDDVIVWLIFAGYIAIFGIVWLFMYLYVMHKVKRMNKNLQRWKAVHPKEKQQHLQADGKMETDGNKP